MPSAVHKFFTTDTLPSAHEESKYAVALTRVSSKRQAEDKASLPVQRRDITRFCQRQGLHIEEWFGETFESAKTDDRKEFQEMLSYIRKNKHIRFIVVWDMDRFSRTGTDSAIALLSSLKKDLKVDVLSATQPYDHKSDEGWLQQNIHLIFAQYENQKRAKRVVVGMKYEMERGNPMFKLPRGYKRDKNTGDVLQDEFAIIVKNCFEKLLQGYRLMHLVQYMERKGHPTRLSTISKMLRNPIYCGIIKNKMMKQPTVGNFQPIVSQETFIKVNRILDKNSKGQMTETGDLTLKGFLTCDKCGKELTSYTSNKNRHGNKRSNPLSYYKCNGKSCKTNINASKLHESFEQVLSRFEVSTELLPLLVSEMNEYLEQINGNINKESASAEKELEKQKRLLDNLELKFIGGEIDGDTYNRFRPQFIKEIEQLNKVLAERPKKLSNTSKIINKALSLCTEIGEFWQKTSIPNKISLQNLIFPGGLSFNKEKMSYRTPRINMIFELISSISGGYKQENPELVVEVSYCRHSEYSIEHLIESIKAIEEFAPT